MEITHEKHDKIVVLKLNGRFDAACAKEFKRSITALTDADSTHIVIDMESVDFVDSSGLGCLVGALRTVNNLGGDIKIASLRPQVRAIFELTRLHRVFAIFNDSASAEKSFQN